MRPPTQAGFPGPNVLTGILDENGTRQATYQYDPQVRAVSSERAGGADRSTFGERSP
jgi:uncharacterized protein RhaS with RHS repeats